MIYLKEVKTRKEKELFYKITQKVYRENPHYRNTEEDVLKLVTGGRSAFHRHARVKRFLIMERKNCVGRFAFIHDEKLPDYLQVGFFEAEWGLENVWKAIKVKALQLFPGVPRVVVGLGGHLNYAAGFLANQFRQPPLFGLPYNPPWYLDYFKELVSREMVSFRFSNTPFIKMRKAGKMLPPLGSITLRFLDMKNLKRDVKIYADLNNECFPDHPYWSDRTVEEDYELFHPFRWLLKSENLIIAEDEGRPVGFLLWYPDFNQLVNQEELGVKALLRYKVLNPIDTARLTEIAVIPEYRRKGVVQGMMALMTDSLIKNNYKYTEGGFIFSENKASIGITTMMLKKAFGKEIKPYRKYVVFDGELQG